MLWPTTRRVFVPLLACCLVVWIFQSFRNDQWDDKMKLMDNFNRSARSCGGLLLNWSKFNLSQEYHRLLQQFETSRNEAIKGAGEAEGFSSQVPEEKIVLHIFAAVKSVKTVCETGFNYGHSSFNFLTANPNAQVHSFDLGNHLYAPKMAKSLTEIFGSRLKVRFGDSRKTVPEAKSTGSLPICDLIFVDGGHVYDVARADLLNFGSHASQDNLVIFDDHPTSWSGSFGKAWDEMLVNEEDVSKTSPLDVDKLNKSADLNSLAGVIGIVEMLRCDNFKKDDLDRAFVVGRYVFKTAL